MAKYTFQTEEGLGDVVESFQPFCTLSSKRPITNVKQITQDICGAKFSKLCGFCFISKQPSQYRRFMIVYCPKTKNNHVRNERGLSGWYCWKHIGFQSELIIDKKSMKSVYGFDVDKFFQSDVFEKYAPIFQKQTSLALDTVVKDFVEKMSLEPTSTQPYSRQETEFFVRCVRDSIPSLIDVTRSVTFGSEDKEAKLAYNANDTYALNMKESEEVDEANHGFPDYEFNTIGDLETYLNAVYQEEDMASRENLVFWDKSGREMKIIKVQLLNNGLNFWFD